VNPSVSANPVEGSPVTFAANGSSPIGLPITYQWQFEQPSNGIIVVIGGQTYNYTDPVSGPTASYVWTTSGTYHVQLTATDAAGKVTVDTFTVNIGDVAPTLTLASTPNALLGCLQLACNTYTVPFGSVTSLFGTITHVGSSDTETVSVNWGDGSSVDTSAVNSDIIYLQSPLSLSTVSPTVITFSDTHTYAKPGSYTVTVTVTDQAGGTSTQTATEVAQAAQAISFASIPEHTYGDPPFAITATGGGSGQPVTFTTTTTTVCTVSGATSGTDGSGDGTGGVTVTLHSAGICAIAANQAGTFNAAGTAIYTAAPQDVQTFSVQQAQLTITADNQTTPYGKVPAFTWTGSPWVNGDSSSTLSTSPNSPPTCSATVNGSAESTSAPPGIYAGAIACQGAVDQNYAITYASGTLTINPLISLDEQGLPSTVPHQATLDGATVTLPDLNVVVPYGSPHQYSFPAAVIAPDGTVYLTNQLGFTGAVTANLSSTAAYQTLSQIVAAALASGGIDNHGVATALTQQFRAVQTAIAAHNVPQALSDLQSFASLVQAQSGKHVTTATATGLLADAQLVYASLGGSGTV
jgi:PKD repeat protein